VPNQKSKISWWPRPAAWNKSGLNVGYWTPACEAWFQNRKTQIAEGTARLLTGSQWKSSMRLFSQSKGLVEINRNASVSFIKLLCSAELASDIV
jgi:hypothetical protein